MRGPMISRFPDLLRRFAATRPDTPAVVSVTGARLSARELDAAAGRGVLRLRAMGVRPGSVVVLRGEPGEAWLAALTACWRAGAVAAPLDYRQTGAERESAARALGRDFDWQPVAAELLSGPAPPDDGVAAWAPDQVLLRVCTSGTTGVPRRVEVTLRQLWFNSLGSRRRLGQRRGDRWLVCLPVNHVGALAAIFRSLHNRGTVELHARFDGDVVGERLDSGEVNVVSLVPAMLDAILDSRGEGAFAPSLRAILLGGAACSERLLARCRKAGLPIALSWGMSETASQVATRRPGDLAPLDDGIPPLPWVRVEAGADGRLIIEGPTAKGRLVSDDLGIVTAAGRVRVLGRSDDAINRGGETIHPREIEVVLEAHPSVTEAVVIGRAHERLGQVPVAFVVGEDPDPDALRAWCHTQIAGFKVPHAIVILDEMPRAGPGKVDRARLRASLSDDVPLESTGRSRG